MADPLNIADPRTARVAAFWEHLSPATLVGLREVYAEHARFRDPFNDLEGAAAIEALLHGMFERLVAPRFVVLEVAEQAEGAVLVWDFHYRLGGASTTRERLIHGCTHLRFGADGRVVEHRDYWDAASQVYEHLPLLGTVLRWLKRRLA